MTAAGHFLIPTEEPECELGGDVTIVDIDQAAEPTRRFKGMKRTGIVAATLLGAALVAAVMHGSTQTFVRDPQDKVSLIVDPVVGNPCEVVTPPPGGWGVTPPPAVAPPPVVASAVVATSSAGPKISPKMMGIFEKTLKAEIQLRRHRVEDGSVRVLSAEDPLTNPATALKELEDAMQSGAGESKRFEAVVNKFKTVITNSFEDMSQNMDVATAAADEMLVTSAALQLANGLTESPESGPDSKHQLDVETVEGDMLFVNAEAKARLLSASPGRRLWAGHLWPNKGAIPFCFHPDISDKARIGFTHAHQHIANVVPCMAFKHVNVLQAPNAQQGPTGGTCEEQGIFVQSYAGGCWSFVGRTGTYQQLNLGSGCESQGISAHELLHALGMGHEQARPDYTENIVIYWDNIKADARNNYNTERDADVGQPYDLMSLMHYGDSDFGKAGKKTMATKAGKSHKGVMGNRMGMTTADSAQLADMYQCTWQKFAQCTTRTDQCFREDCVCHQEPGSTSNSMKVTDSDGCHRCLEQCIDSTQGGNSCTVRACVCPAGMDKRTFNLADGAGKCYDCYGTRTATPAPTPAPTSGTTMLAPTTLAPTTPAPLAACQFPTNLQTGICGAHPNMPGCTDCDGQLAWCFTSTTGNWRSCVKEDNACMIPFTYNGKEYWECMTDDHSVPWCVKYGGGWKVCTESDSLLAHPSAAPETAVPAPPPPPPPTPAPTPALTPAGLPAGCKFPFTFSGTPGVVFSDAPPATSMGCLNWNGNDYCRAHDDTWRYCTVEENICHFPFNWGGNTYDKCAPAWWSYGGHSWCYTAGGDGGWKYC